VFCAVLYLLRSGCQWRMLPDEFPKWRTVHRSAPDFEQSLQGIKYPLFPSSCN
jgi:transposase